MAGGSRPQKGAAAAIAANRAASPRKGGGKIALKTVSKNETLVSQALKRATYV